jgi:SAM-dependent methyltransferase
MKSLVDSRALATAFEMNLIDFFQQMGASPVEALAKEFQIDDLGLRMLVNLLAANRVVENAPGGISLTGQFTEALQYRDLMEAKLDFIHFVAHDFIDLFSDLIHSPEKFMQHANIFKLFSYDRCFQYTAENYQLTKRWMRITSMLTKYESQACLRYHDFSGYRRILDVGGNSGEFVLRICRQNPAILTTVFDLPLVCDIGLEHIQPEPEAGRITFVKGNAVSDNLPTGFDIITFKSILHDWPEEQAKKFILKASKSLAPGGTLLIFERGPFSPICRFCYSVHRMIWFKMNNELLTELAYKDILTFVYNFSSDSTWGRGGSWCPAVRGHNRTIKKGITNKKH